MPRDAAAARDVLEQQLSDADAVLAQAQANRAADAAAAAQRLAERQSDFEIQLATATSFRAAAEQQIEALRATLQQTVAGHEAERAADAERRAAHDAETAEDLAQVARKEKVGKAEDIGWENSVVPDSGDFVPVYEKVCGGGWDCEWPPETKSLAEELAEDAAERGMEDDWDQDQEDHGQRRLGHLEEIVPGHVRDTLARTQS